MDLSELIAGQPGIHSRILDLPGLYQRKEGGKLQDVKIQYFFKEKKISWVLRRLRHVDL